MEKDLLSGKIAEPMALYSGPEQQFEYPNGDYIQGFAVAFIIREWTGIPCANGKEGSEVQFWPLDHLPKNLMKRHLEVLKNFQRYTGKFILSGSRVEIEIG